MIGIIAEGRPDQAILKNILRAFGFDGSEIRAIRPNLAKDETSLHLPIPVEINEHRGFSELYHNISNTSNSIGTWQGVKNACLSRADFKRFFQLDGGDYIIIQLDTAEIDAVDNSIKRPSKNDANYCTDLRNAVIQKINQWLQNHYQNKLFYAISIEEIEAWALTIYTNQNTAQMVNVKGKLSQAYGKKNITMKGCRDEASFFEEKVTVEFRKKKNLKTFIAYNQSLKDFVDSINAVFPTL